MRPARGDRVPLRRRGAYRAAAAAERADRRAVGRLPVHAQQPQGSALRALAPRPWLRALVQPRPRHGQRPDPRGLPDGRAPPEDRALPGHVRPAAAEPRSRWSPHATTTSDERAPRGRTAGACPRAGGSTAAARSASRSTARATRASPATRWRQPCSPSPRMCNSAKSS